MKLKEMLEASKLKNNILKIVLAVLFMSVFNSLSYAYFTSEIEGKGNEMVLSTSDISIKFTDSESIKKTGLTPGSTITKTFTITNNSDSSASYKINWEYLINNFIGKQNLVYTISSNNGGGNLSETQLPDGEEHINILDNLTINTKTTQNYTMTITYKDNGQNQDLDKNKSLIGKLEVTDLDGNSILPETSTGSSASVITSEKNLYGLKMKDLVNTLYPVGSVYISFNSTNPSEIMGGSWERVDKGKTLINVDEEDTTFASVGKTGGSKSTVLKTENLPNHTHSIPELDGSTSEAGEHQHSLSLIFGPSVSSAVTAFKSFGMGADSGRNVLNGGNTSNNGKHSHNITTNESTTGSVGSATSFNNLQPYITVYMWKRIS